MRFDWGDGRRDKGKLRPFYVFRWHTGSRVFICPTQSKAPRPTTTSWCHIVIIESEVGSRYSGEPLKPSSWDLHLGKDPLAPVAASLLSHTHQSALLACTELPASTPVRFGARDCLCEKSPTPNLSR